MDTGIIIQARMGSTRRPGKINYPFEGEPMLAYQIRRLLAGQDGKVIVATTDLPTDDVTEAIAKSCNVPCFRGSENDVINRYLACAEAYDVQQIVRVCGDDPLVDPDCVKRLVDIQTETGADLVYASHPAGWLYGTTVEVVTYQALHLAASMTDSPHYHEHVVSFIKDTPRFQKIAASPLDENQIRPDIYLSVDYQEDLDLVEQIVAEFTRRGKRYDFTQDELILLYDSGTLDIRNRHLHTGF